MDADIPDDLIAIDDPELDAGAIMAQIRERVRQRREALGYDKRTFVTFGNTSYPGEPDDFPYDPNLYHHLRLANDTFVRPPLEVMLPPSPASRLPVIGGLWQRLRPAVHHLILFYVNRAIAQEVTLNRHLVSVLNQLTRLTQEQQRAIIALQREVAELRRGREG